MFSHDTHCNQTKTMRSYLFSRIHIFLLLIILFIFSSQLTKAFYFLLLKVLLTFAHPFPLRNI